MNKIIFFENNIEPKICRICLYLLRRFKYYEWGDYYCLRYNWDSRIMGYKYYKIQIDGMLGESHSYSDKLCYHTSKDIYLFNQSEVENKKVIKLTERYIHKDLIKLNPKRQELSNFENREVVTFSNEDFNIFRKICEIFIKKILEKEKRFKEIEEFNKNKYQYISYALFQLLSEHLPEHILFEHQVQVIGRDFISTRFANALTDELKSLLDKKGVKMAKS